jgi:hypothetical protein
VLSGVLIGMVLGAGGMFAIMKAQGRQRRQFPPNQGFPPPNQGFPPQQGYPQGPPPPRADQYPPQQQPPRQW